MARRATLLVARRVTRRFVLRVTLRVMLVTRLTAQRVARLEHGEWYGCCSSLATRRATLLQQLFVVLLMEIYIKCMKSAKFRAFCYSHNFTYFYFAYPFTFRQISRVVFAYLCTVFLAAPAGFSTKYCTVIFTAEYACFHTVDCMFLLRKRCFWLQFSFQKFRQTRKRCV